MDAVLNLLTQLLQGLGNTLLLFVMTLVFSLPLGLVVTFGRMSKFKPLQYIVRFLISILRGTPLMLQIIVVFFGPYYVFHTQLSASYRVIAVILAFSINYAAYFAEIFRSGIESIPIGQYEAAQVLGYSKKQTFFKIILPQMIKRVLPPVTNEVITLVKDTSLAFVITYTEMFTVAKQIAAAKTTIMPLFVAGVFYFIFNGVVAWAMERIEHRLAYYN
jgi:His/Glu/Gln/Arg/opine family amino acid ABC transporter permease subunit